MGNAYKPIRRLFADQPRPLYQFSPTFSASNILASFNAAARRSSHSLVTEAALSQTPEHVPFSDHNPMADAFLNHIPRFAGQTEEVLGMSLEKDTKSCSQMITRLPGTCLGLWTFLSHTAFISLSSCPSLSTFLSVLGSDGCHVVRNERLGLEYMLQCCSRFSIKSQIFL